MKAPRKLVEVAKELDEATEQRDEVAADLKARLEQLKELTQRVNALNEEARTMLEASRTVPDFVVEAEAIVSGTPAFEGRAPPPAPPSRPLTPKRPPHVHRWRPGTISNFCEECKETEGKPESNVAAIYRAGVSGDKFTVVAVVALGKGLNAISAGNQLRQLAGKKRQVLRQLDSTTFQIGPQFHQTWPEPPPLTRGKG